MKIGKKRLIIYASLICLVVWLVYFDVISYLEYKRENSKYRKTLKEYEKYEKEFKTLEKELKELQIQIENSGNDIPQTNTSTSSTSFKNSK